MTFKLGIAQINCRLGDLKSNIQKILDSARQAYQQGARLLVTPELALTGYSPDDLLLRPAFLLDCEHALDRLRIELAQFTDLYVLVGHPMAHSDGRLSNAASVFLNGETVGMYRKHHLPNYGVFDEKRYFQSGQTTLHLDIGGHRFGILICEDLWFNDLALTYQQLNVDTIISLNASPFHRGKQQDRLDIARHNVTRHNLGLVYVNMVGGQDELVFDGHSFVLDSDGHLQACLPPFHEQLAVVDLDLKPKSKQVYPMLAPEAELYQALVLSLKDYVYKNGFSSVLLGLSGGVDSALVLAIAYDALGANAIRTVMMPSAYTADISTSDAYQMATGLGVRYDVRSIMSIVQSLNEVLAPDFSGLAEDITEENIQARARAVILMALSNKFGSLVLPTGNKSEMATGYCTLYGDMVGGFALLKDVTKTWVYRLCRWRNQQSQIIPERIITRPPSAELRPDQVDQDSLPEYDVLDAILERYMEQNASIDTLIQEGFKQEDIHRLVKLLRINEYKRRQAAIGPKISTRAFGRDWRYPITSGYIKEGI